MLLAALLLVLPRQEDSTPESPRNVKTAAPASNASPGLAPDVPSTPPPALAAVTTDGGVAPDTQFETQPPGEPARHPVDLTKLRERLPDNLYWELGAPTKDPEVLRKRAEDSQRWNELYGKVLSGTATEQEIRQYYDHRRKVSEDYIAFASLVLQEHGTQLSEQERGLYELSIRMHHTRLEEIPGQIDDALARKLAQDQRRKEWLGNGRGN